jgi:hypothetical protein
MPNLKRYYGNTPIYTQEKGNFGEGGKLAAAAASQVQ